jgi:glycosyltransferase involved in cell wall biosynthesis
MAEAATAGTTDVSVLLITYNHAPYIRRAAESVLSQDAARGFELIISEDASTDGTRAIVEEIAAADPRVRLMLSERNIKSNETIARAIRAARGKYICILDGDDHWIANNKIERQAALLDAHADVSACFHNALIVRGDADEPGEDRWTPGTQPARTSFAALWEGNPFATGAGMLRRDALDRLGDWYAACFPYTDWPLYLLCAERCDLMFVDEPVAAYRLHEGGAVSGLPGVARLELTARFYRQMMQVDGGRWRSHARRGGARYFRQWSSEYARSGDRPMARVCARLARELGGIRETLSMKRRSFA